MINDSSFANPEDRLQDLIINIEEMKGVLDDILTSLEDNEDYENASEAIVSVERAADALDAALDEVEAAVDLL